VLFLSKNGVLSKTDQNTPQMCRSSQRLWPRLEACRHQEPQRAKPFLMTLVAAADKITRTSTNPDHM